MLIFFDTEFTDLCIGSRLIGIGLISEDGREFYAELSDTYEIKDCCDFVQEEVLPHLARTLHKPSPPEINRNDVELINFQVKIPQPQDIGQKGWRLWWQD
jgi:hypothetical protein